MAVSGGRFGKLTVITLLIPQLLIVTLGPATYAGNIPCLLQTRLEIHRRSCVFERRFVHGDIHSAVARAERPGCRHAAEEA